MSEESATLQGLGAEIGPCGGCEQSLEAGLVSHVNGVVAWKPHTVRAESGWQYGGRDRSLRCVGRRGQWKKQSLGQTCREETMERWQIHGPGRMNAGKSSR